MLDRLDIIRDKERLNKTQFEKVLGKSTGYINTLRKNKSLPGLEVLLKISDNYPHYNLMWLLKGEGDMLKSASQKGQNEDSLAREDGERYPNLSEMHADLKKDLAALAEGMTKNFEVVSKGIMRGLKDQQKILDFIKDLDAKEISTASKGLNEFLQEKE